MSNHKAIVCKVKVTPHPDPEVHSLAVGTVMGETIIVGKDTEDGALGLYFPCELQLSELFARRNDLIRRKNPETGKSEGGMFDANRRVRIQKFRGVKSHGFWCPLSYLSHFGNPSDLKEGDQLDEFKGTKICCKYVSRRNPARKNSSQKATKKKELCFPEHRDTEQLRYNIEKINIGDKLIITNKVHGTSQRTGKVLANRKLKWYERLLRRMGVPISENEVKILNGTRRVVLDEPKDGFHCPQMREKAASKITPYLEDHMIVYYEVVGFEGPDKPIMPRQPTKRSNNKKLRKKYGETITYTYGCADGEFEVFVYRIVWVLANGKTVDWTWNEVKAWCDHHNIRHVPEIKRYDLIGDDVNIVRDMLMHSIEEDTEGEDPIDSRHPKEGVCVRIDKPGWHTFKHKSWDFKVLEQIVKDDENYVDMEEES